MTAAQSHGDRGQRDLEPDLAGPTVGDLDLDGLLAEVLDQAMAALDADTATVLLVDASGTELVARASRGLEEEVHQGVRIRIGEGFAGRIASQGRPAMIDRVDETTVVNPILWRRGLRTMVGVPLLSGDSTIGVLHVGSATRDAFTEADAATALLACVSPACSHFEHSLRTLRTAVHLTGGAPTSSARRGGPWMTRPISMR